MIIQDQQSESIRVFVVSFAACLSVALINGYPLLFPDSYSYLGFDPWSGVYSPRSITLGFFARTFYPIFGVWSVILIQATVVSYLMSLFSAQYLAGGRTLELSALIVFSQLPFFVSFAMADVWFVIFVLAFLFLIKTFRWPPLLILAFAITVHGSHLYIFITSAILALLIFKGKFHILKITIAAILLASIFTTFVNGLMGYDKNSKITWSFLGSKILTQIPDAIDYKCADDPSFLMCLHRENIQKGILNRYIDNDPAGFLWDDQSFFAIVDKSELTTASRELFIYTLLNLPEAFTKATISDFLMLFISECGIDFRALNEAESGITPDIPGAPLLPNELIANNAEYERTLQAAGIWGQESQGGLMLKIFRLTTYVLCAIGLLLSFFLRLQEAIKVGLFCILVFLANDLLFAAVSGPYPRFHNRGLFLLVIPALMTISEIRKRRDSM